VKAFALVLVAALFGLMLWGASCAGRFEADIWAERCQSAFANAPTKADTLLALELNSDCRDWLR
jgi:hypothetical protein